MIITAIFRGKSGEKEGNSARKKKIIDSWSGIERCEFNINNIYEMSISTSKGGAVNLTLISRPELGCKYGSFLEFLTEWKKISVVEWP